MSNQEILEKAIQKAIDNGWSPALKGKSQDEIRYIVEENLGRTTYSIIFNHDFAKALWGKDYKPYAQVWQQVNDMQELESAVLNHQLPAWQYHLQQMVIADDPIQYLGEHLDD